MLKKFWNDPVWSKVIAAGILALVGAIWLAHKANWLPAMWNVPTVAWHGITVAWAYLLGTTTIPRWKLGVYMLGTGLSVLLVAGLIVILWKAKKEAQSTPAWLSYTTHNFFG